MPYWLPAVHQLPHRCAVQLRAGASGQPAGHQRTEKLAGPRQRRRGSDRAVDQRSCRAADGAGASGPAGDRARSCQPGAAGLTRDPQASSNPGT